MLIDYQDSQFTEWCDRCTCLVEYRVYLCQELLTPLFHTYLLTNGDVLLTSYQEPQPVLSFITCGVSGYRSQYYNVPVGCAFSHPVQFPNPTKLGSSLGSQFR